MPSGKMLHASLNKMDLLKCRDAVTRRLPTHRLELVVSRMQRLSRETPITNKVVRIPMLVPLPQ